jgi:predicted nucleotidyltransferase
MGTKRSVTAGSGLAAVLFTPVQQRVLGLLFGQPDRRFQSAELIRLAESGTGAVHRQLQRLAAAGLVTVTREGHQKYYQANRDAPIFPELHGLVVKTVGAVEPLREAFEPLRARITAAFVYGSTARGTEHGASDLDLMVVSADLGYPELYEALLDVERVLARSVHPTIISPEEWRAQREQRDSFAARISTQPRRFVVGNEDALD